MVPTVPTHPSIHTHIQG